MTTVIKRLVVTTIGCLIAGVAINTFLVPHEMLAGGTTGIAIILHYLFGLPIGPVMIALNVPLFAIAWRIVSRHTLYYGLFGMLMSSLAISATHFFADYRVSDDILLSAVYGGVLSGVGYGLILRVDANTGGNDIIGKICKKLYDWNIGIVGFYVNVSIMAVSAVLLGIKPALYTLISMYCTATLIDKVVEGFNRSKIVTIISDRSEAIALMILGSLTRGVTFLEGEGAYSHKNKKVLFCVISLSQLVRVRQLVEQIDPQAFMIVQEAAEVRGRGFSRIN
ncbi:MAG: YitT family protein [Negativicutes bacterium]|nr:YitT family protein [Negativicutes bacterium]